MFFTAEPGLDNQIDCLLEADALAVTAELAVGFKLEVIGQEIVLHLHESPKIAIMKKNQKKKKKKSKSDITKIC